MRQDEELIVGAIYVLAFPARTVPHEPNSLPPAARVEIDNQHVRVIRRYHAPHEKVAMHSRMALSYI
jgi:hypothetical protein